MSRSVEALLVNLRQEHAKAIASARDCVLSMIKCGKILVAAKSNCPHGTWEDWLQRAGISETTARRYRLVAEAASSDPKKVNYLLKNGSGLVDVLRAFGLVKPCKPGDYDPETYQARKANEDVDQLRFDFKYENCADQLECLIKAPNVEDLAPSSLFTLKKNLHAALDRIDRLMTARAATIDLETVFSPSPSTKLP